MSNSMRAFLIVLGIGLCLGASSSSLLFASEEAESVIREATEAIYLAMDQQCELIKADPAYLHTLVDRILIPHADFQRMSQWVLGKHWRTIDQKQREMFAEQFRQLLIRTYATAIQLAALEDINYLPRRESARRDRATVRAEIDRPGEPSVALTYALYQHHGVWLVYDILVDGVSLVSNYRTTFANEIRSQGFDALLRSLQQKNSEAMTEAAAGQIRSRISNSCRSGK